MSLKARFRRIEAGVRWLETEGLFRHFEAGMKLVEKLQEISDRIASDPAAAARWKESWPNFPYTLPPPRVPVVRPPPDPKPVPLPDPKPVIVPQTLPANVEPPPARPAPVLKSPPPSPPRPPAPLPGMPVSPPSPDMEIRPVRWRGRGPQDHVDEGGDAYGTHGECLTEYDVLRDEDDD